MNLRRRRLRNSEWVIFLSPFLLLATFLIVNQWRRRYVPVTLNLGADTARVESLTFSPDGRYLAVEELSRGYIVSLWDCQAMQKLWEAPFHSMTWLPQFSPDSKQIGIYNADSYLPDPETGKPCSSVQLFDVRSRQMLSQLPVGIDGRIFRFFPDGKRLLIDGVPLREWNLQTGRVIRVINRHNSPKHGLEPIDGRYLVIHEGQKVRYDWLSTAVTVYDLVAGKTVNSIAVPENSYAFGAHESDSIWITQRKTRQTDIYLWNWQTGQKSLRKTIPNKSIQLLSPSSEVFACVEPQTEWGSDGKIKSISSFDITCEDSHTREILWRVTTPNSILPFHFFPDGQHIVDSEGKKQKSNALYTTTTSAVVIRKAQTGATVRTFNADGICQLSPDGKQLALANEKTVQIFDVSDLCNLKK